MKPPMQSPYMAKPSLAPLGFKVQTREFLQVSSSTDTHAVQLLLALKLLLTHSNKHQ